MTSLPRLLGLAVALAGAACLILWWVYAAPVHIVLPLETNVTVVPKTIVRDSDISFPPLPEPPSPPGLEI